MFNDWIEIGARLALSVLAGTIIGLNRDLHGKPAGVRTHSLVSLGTALAVILVVPLHDDVAMRYDALSRVIQGVVTGIGFLGAGVIVRDAAKKHVSGLTTAAAIWFAAILGLACGAGQYVPVIMALALGLLVVLCGGPFERWFRPRGAHEDDPSNPPTP